MELCPVVPQFEGATLTCKRPVLTSPGASAAGGSRRTRPVTSSSRLTKSLISAALGGTWTVGRLAHHTIVAASLSASSRTTSHGRAVVGGGSSPSGKVLWPAAA